MLGKNNNPEFDVTMGSYDSAETANIQHPPQCHCRPIPRWQPDFNPQRQWSDARQNTTNKTICPNKTICYLLLLNVANFQKAVAKMQQYNKIKLKYPSLGSTQSTQQIRQKALRLDNIIIIINFTADTANDFPKSFKVSAILNTPQVCVASSTKGGKEHKFWCISDIFTVHTLKLATISIPRSIIRMYTGIDGNLLLYAGLGYHRKVIG